MNNLQRLQELWVSMGFKSPENPNQLVVPSPEELVQIQLKNAASEEIKAQYPDPISLFKHFEGKIPVGKESAYAEFVSIAKALNDGSLNSNGSSQKTTEATKKVEEAHNAVLNRDHLYKKPESTQTNHLVQNAFEKAQKLNGL